MEEILHRSESFHRQLGWDLDAQNRIKWVLRNCASATPGAVDVFARTTRPIVNGEIPGLLQNYLDMKRLHGSDLEKMLYEQMSVSELFERLLKCRPIVFMNTSDEYLLLDNRRGSGRFFETLQESDSLFDLISYDEMNLSSLISMSVPTFFINRGDRDNMCRREEDNTRFQVSGIYVGCVGARFEKRGFNEWRHVIVSAEQNTLANGYGRDGSADPAAVAKAAQLCLWAHFYSKSADAYLPTFEEVTAQETADPVQFRTKYLRKQIKGSTVYFNTEIYRKRMRMTVEPFLLDANDRAMTAGKPAHCVAVGLGLGVWKLFDEQSQLLLDVYAEVLSEVPLPHIAELNFSWFSGPVHCGGAGHNDTFRSDAAGNTHIRILFTKGNPADPIGDARLLVAQYAWDGNRLVEQSSR